LARLALVLKLSWGLLVVLAVVLVAVASEAASSPVRADFAAGPFAERKRFVSQRYGYKRRSPPAL
jgi:hypothetical protein